MEKNYAINKIAKILDEKGIPILKISKETGLSYSSLHNTVKREYLDKVTLSTLIKIADVLGCEVGDLFDRS